MVTTLSNRSSRSLQPMMEKDPFTHLQQEMDELLNRFRSGLNGELLPKVTIPSVDLSETGDSLQVRMDVPGMKAEEINVDICGTTLRVSGEHKEEKEEKGETYYRQERRRGAFARSLVLPTAIKEGKVIAECKDGVLTITLPKADVAITHKVKVKNGGK